MKYIIAIAFFALFPFIPLNAQETYTYSIPDVRNDFCGIEINYQYCKCAFHGDMCNARGLSQSGARSEVMRQFRNYVGDKIESMGRGCLSAGNQWNKNTRTCTVIETEEETIEATVRLEDQYNFPEMTGVPEPTKTGYYGKVSKADGDVFVYQWAFGRWVRAVPGQPIYHGDFVHTLTGTTRIIYNGQFGDDVLNLSPDALLETGRPGPALRPASEFSLLGVVRDGAVDVYSTLKEGAEQENTVPTWYNQLHTPNVSTGRRGTHYAVAFNPSTQETTVTLFEGGVDIATSSDSAVVSLYPGEQAVVENTVATSSLEDSATYLASVGLPQERVDATEEELTHTAPATPVDETKEPEPTREELVGDLSDIEEQFESSNTALWIILLIVIAGGGVWYYRTKIKK